VEINPELLERLLPEVEHTALPAVKEVGFAIAAGRYGTGSPVEERALQDLSDAAVSHIDALGDEPNVDEGAFEAWRQCFEGMFRDAAQRYGKAAAAQALDLGGSDYPSLSDDMEGAAETCLSDQFEETQAQVLANHMGNALGAWAQDASHTDSAAAVLSKWFDNTADQLAGTASSTETTSDESTSEESGGAGGGGGSGDGGGSSSTPWIVGVLIAAAAGALALYVHSQKRTH
jgi:hypothetical protein